MPKKRRAKERQQTHLGWRPGQSKGQAAPDHLLLGGSWLDTPNGAENGATAWPVLEFVDPTTTKAHPEAGEAGDPSPVDFLEVQDSRLESPPFLWDSNWNLNPDSGAREQDVVVFEESGSVANDSATIFS
jgi:hypothetical protein